jgi:hypothetical protein
MNAHHLGRRLAGLLFDDDAGLSIIVSVLLPIGLGSVGSVLGSLEGLAGLFHLSEEPLHHSADRACEFGNLPLGRTLAVVMEDD